MYFCTHSVAVCPCHATAVRNVRLRHDLHYKFPSLLQRPPISWRSPPPPPPPPPHKAGGRRPMEGLARVKFGSRTDLRQSLRRALVAGRARPPFRYFRHGRSALLTAALRTRRELGEHNPYSFPVAGLAHKQRLAALAVQAQVRCWERTLPLPERHTFLSRHCDKVNRLVRRAIGGSRSAPLRVVLACAGHEDRSRQRERRAELSERDPGWDEFVAFLREEPDAELGPPPSPSAAVQGEDRLFCEDTTVRKHHFIDLWKRIEVVSWTRKRREETMSSLEASVPAELRRMARAAARMEQLQERIKQLHLAAQGVAIALSHRLIYTREETEILQKRIDRFKARLVKTKDECVMHAEFLEVSRRIRWFLFGLSPRAWVYEHGGIPDISRPLLPPPEMGDAEVSDLWAVIDRLENHYHGIYFRRPSEVLRELRALEDATLLYMYEVSAKGLKIYSFKDKVKRFGEEVVRDTAVMRQAVDELRQTVESEERRVAELTKLAREYAFGHAHAARAHHGEWEKLAALVEDMYAELQLGGLFDIPPLAMLDQINTLAYDLMDQLRRLPRNCVLQVVRTLNAKGDRFDRREERLLEIQRWCHRLLKRARTAIAEAPGARRPRRPLPRSVPLRPPSQHRRGASAPPAAGTHAQFFADDL